MAMTLSSVRAAAARASHEKRWRAALTAANRGASNLMATNL